MSNTETVAETARKRTVVIREDYPAKEWWSIDEAADYTGRSASAILLWMRHKPALFIIASRATRFRIHAETFKLYVQTGTPQSTLDIAPPVEAS